MTKSGVQGLGLKVSGLGFGVLGLELRVQGLKDLGAFYGRAKTHSYHFKVRKQRVPLGLSAS